MRSVMPMTVSKTEQRFKPYLLSVASLPQRHTDPMELHDRIRAARTAAGLTQRQLARALNVSPSAVAQWEAGDTRPKHGHLLAIAAQTRSDPAALLGIHAQPIDHDTELRALIRHWHRVPASQRGMVLRLILAATDAPASDDDDSPQAA